MDSNIEIFPPSSKYEFTGIDKQIPHPDTLAFQKSVGKQPPPGVEWTHHNGNLYYTQEKISWKIYFPVIVFAVIAIIMLILAIWFPLKYRVKSVILIASAIYVLIIGAILWMTSASGYMILSWIVLGIAIFIWALLWILIYTEVVSVDF